MAGVMAATFIVSVRWMPRGRVEPADDEEGPVPDGAAVEHSV